MSSMGFCETRFPRQPLGWPSFYRQSLICRHLFELSFVVPVAPTVPMAIETTSQGAFRALFHRFCRVVGHSNTHFCALTYWLSVC